MSEQGAFGASIIASVAYGVYDSIESAVDEISLQVKRKTPNSNRTKLYAEKMHRWENIVDVLKPSWATW